MIKFLQKIGTTFSPRLNDVRGVSMIELILGTTMLVVVVVGVMLFLPRSTQTLEGNRHHWEATNLAMNLIQSFQSEPYPLVPLTPALGAIFVNSGVGNTGGCNCTAEDPSTLPLASTPTVVLNGTTYTQQACVNQMDSTGQSYCPAANSTLGYVETHLKNIRVRISWPVGGTTQFIDMEAQVYGS